MEGELFYYIIIIVVLLVIIELTLIFESIFLIELILPIP